MKGDLFASVQGLDASVQEDVAIGGVILVCPLKIKDRFERAEYTRFNEIENIATYYKFFLK
jgi:hypothetical protein